MHTVPLRPGGGGQRANRIDTPSGVFNVPVTAPSGTGLAGMETRLMRKRRTEDGGRRTDDRYQITANRKYESFLGRYPSSICPSVLRLPLEGRTRIPISGLCRPFGCTYPVGPSRADLS